MTERLFYSERNNTSELHSVRNNGWTKIYEIDQKQTIFIAILTPSHTEEEHSILTGPGLVL